MDTIEYKSFQKTKQKRLEILEKLLGQKPEMEEGLAKLMFQKPKTVKLSAYERMLERAKNKRVAVKVKRKAKKRVKLPSIRKLVLKADQVFARFIRERDGNKCVLCGSTNNPTCGHLIKRGKKPTRYSEMNCNCLCMGCNYKDNFEHDHYVMWFIKQYGVEKYEMLIELSKEFHKWTREELLEIISMYDNKT